MKDILAVSSLLISVLANIPYVIEIIRGKVKPERVSWLLWTLLGATYYFSSVIDDGAKFFTLGELIGPVIIFILSLKYGVGGKSRFDIVSLFIALLALGLLLIVDGTLPSLLIALFVDTIGITLTIRKLLLDPASESRTFWSMGAVASLLAIFSLDTFSIETLLFPLYVLAVSTFIAAKSNPNKEAHLQNIKKL